jgi:hypothetical protein
MTESHNNNMTRSIIHEPGNYNFLSPSLDKGVNDQLKSE